MPSNRIWYGFVAPPKLDLSIRSLISDTSIPIGMIQQTIQRKINESICETIVLPHMDDITLPVSDEKRSPRRGLADVLEDPTSHKLDRSATVSPVMQTPSRHDSDANSESDTPRASGSETMPSRAFWRGAKTVGPSFIRLGSNREEPPSE
jgi:hypothetical protein